jgi:large subunit ribosomal protein L3
MINAIIGTKIDNSQGFTQDGVRIPLTRIKVGMGVVTQVKTTDHDGYNAIQIGWGETRKTNKPQTGHLKKAKLEKAPLFLAEIRTDGVDKFKIGDQIDPAKVIKEGDLVKVAGISKGKGFQGVVRRWHFKGGPRTHGQSDRERAPGSIGQTTTPGRVYRGKHMAGRMGNQRITTTGLVVMEVNEKDNFLVVKGLVPGARNGKLIVTKTGEKKNFVSLMGEGLKEIKETEEAKAERLRIEKESEEKLKETPKDA